MELEAHTLGIEATDHEIRSPKYGLLIPSTTGKKKTLMWDLESFLGISSDSRTQQSWKVGSKSRIRQGIHFWHLFWILKNIPASSSAFVATQSEISKIDQIWKCYIDHESEMQLKTNGVFGTYPNTRYCVTFFDFQKHQKSYVFCNLIFFQKNMFLKS